MHCDVVCVRRNAPCGPLIDSDDLLIVRHHSCWLRVRGTEIDVDLTGATGDDNLRCTLRRIWLEVIKLSHEIDGMKLIPSMSSFVLIIPAEADVVRIIFPESSHQANIVLYLNLTRLKIERMSRMERPPDVIYCIYIIRRYPIDWMHLIITGACAAKDTFRFFRSSSSRRAAMDLNLEIVSHINIAVIAASELPGGGT
jgi:hypothetical protein